MYQDDNSPDDVWIDTVCEMCYNACSVRVHRVNGVVLKIEGDPNAPNSRGKLCAKGHAALITLYDPHRVKTPLMRTNPAKGIGIDPEWQEITWEEGLAIVEKKLREVREDDPRKLVTASFDCSHLRLLTLWGTAFGTATSVWDPADYYCGAALHTMTYLTNGTFHSEVDLDYCDYCILIGNQHGFGTGLNSNFNTQKMAEARRRGMKLVVVDPICNSAGAKADVWVPIRPGTDAALALSMVNIIINQLGIYDEPFIKKQTNGPYLIGPDGRYVREKGTGKPLIWDTNDNEARPFDSEIGAPAILGEYVVEGVVCKPAFLVLKEHVASYAPEKVAEITTVPANVIQRIAREFGEAARVGSTIVIDGQELPHRPVAVNGYRGAFTHKHGALASFSVQLLNIVVGAIHVPGSHRGINAVGPSWAPHEGPDGLVVGPAILHTGRDPYEFLNYSATKPSSVELKELFPLGHRPGVAVQLALQHPDEFCIPAKPEVLIQCRTNLMMSTVNPEQTAEALRRFSFIISFARELGESEEFADIVFPEAHQLERFSLFPQTLIRTVSAGMGDWYYEMMRPVVDPPDGVRRWTDVLLELARRLGFSSDLNEILNAGLGLKEPYRLDRTEEYTREEISDRQARSALGPEKGLDWFQENGRLRLARTVEERYPRPFIKARIPLYFEHLLQARDYVLKVAGGLGLSWDVSDYQPLPDWKPCPSYQPKLADYDLYVVNYKLPFHTFSITTDNPWLDDVARHHPSAYKILMGSGTARKKGIRDGDTIRLETVAGHEVAGVVKTSECIHPEVLGVAGTFGHWAKGLPIAKGKGVHFNTLIPSDLEQVDMISLAVDSCVRVKVHKEG